MEKRRQSPITILPVEKMMEDLERKEAGTLKNLRSPNRNVTGIISIIYFHKILFWYVHWISQPGTYMEK